MKTLLTHLCLLFATLLPAQTNTSKVIDNPISGATNTRTVQISKVELTSTETILHIDAFYRPNRWIRIAGDSYLMANKQRYMITSSEGIELDKEFWMPQSGEASFKLFFPALPKDTKSFDFIESDCDDCFKIFDIDLTGLKKHLNYPEGLPTIFQKTYKDGALPPYDFKAGTTKVKVKLLGYRKGLATELQMYVNSLLDSRQNMEAKIEPDGTAYFEFEQYGTVFVYISMSNITINGTICVSPGESAEVYIDLQAIAHKNKIYNKTKEYPSGKHLYTTGKYAALNHYMASADLSNNYSMDLYSGQFANYKWTADQYLEHTSARYDSLLLEVNNNKKLPRMLKEFYATSLKRELLDATISGNYILTQNYRNTFNKWNRDDSIDYPIATITDQQMAILKKKVDYNDPTVLMGKEVNMVFHTIYYPTHLFTDATEGLLYDIKNLIPMLRNAKQGNLTEQDKKALSALSIPFYLEVISSIQRNTEHQLESIKNSTAMQPTPEVPIEKLFDTIIAKYKGKIIVVDFWNTWCGPCRSAMKKLEPVKSKDLKRDDLVWIYIANESSPKTEYMINIAKIQGDHYRISLSQWDYIFEKFKIKGIPAYVIVDKQGNYSLRNDLRDHNLMKKTLIELINQ